MAAIQDFLWNFFNRRRVPPQETAGVPGVAVYAGYVDSGETHKDLSSPEARYRTYGNILSNVSIVAAGVRLFVNMMGRTQWSFSPSEADKSGEFAERLEEILTSDPATPWHRIVRRASMYRFYGFSIQEWTAKRHEDGHFTFADIAPRAQRTIHRWDVDPKGAVMGVAQRAPQTAQEIYLPRNKLLYLVDDTLNDSPEGLGLFRHLVESANRLKLYEKLEGFGFENDLRGIPIGYAPFTGIAERVANGTISDEARKRIEQPLRDWMANHVRGPKGGLLLDSAVYTSEDDAGRPINAKQWQVDVLSSDASSFSQNASAIERLNREIARVLGVEHLLLGATSAGSFALSEDKTHQFHQIVEGALSDLREAVDADLVDVIWKLNGWPPEMKPEASTETVRYRDIAQMAQVLRDMATAGAPLEPDDGAINDVRDLLGVSRVDLDAAGVRAAEDAALRRAETEALRSQPEEPGEPGQEDAA